MRRLIALAVALLALPAAARADVDETYLVPTVDGASLYVKVRRPDGVAHAPVILTYSPYNVLNAPDPTQDAVGNRYVPKGYVRAVADVLGTRNSSGCWDYGGTKEQQSGVDLVSFLAKQPWSNGRVAMIGGSYDGTTANMVAARGADAAGLAAIVPIAAITRWYGYAYYAGVRYSDNSQNPSDEGFDTPAGFDFGFGSEPADDPAVTGPQPTIDRANPCDRVSHTQHGYSTAPDYDDFWLQRDYRKDAAKFRVPVLIAHGWQDFNVKQDEGVGLYEALKHRSAWTGLYMTQGQHSEPSGDPWETLVDEFFDRFLKDQPNDLPPHGAVYSTPRDAGGPKDVEPEADWPPPTTGDVAIALGTATRSYTDTGTVSEEAASQSLDSQAAWLAYRSAPLTQDARLAGKPELDLTISVDRDHGQLVPTLFDEAPDGTLTPITRGFLNLAYRDGWSKGVPMPTAKPVALTVDFLPQDWLLPKGHRLTLEVASSNVAWAVPDQPGLTVTVDEAHSRLRVPLVGAAPAPAPAPLPIPGATRATPPRLRLAVTRRGRRLTARLSGPADARVTLRLTRGRRTVARRSAILRGGRATVRVRVRRPGRYRLVARSGSQRLSKRIRVR